MPIDSRPEVTKEEIENKINQKDIFEFYLGINVNLTDTYTSPFRVDDRPGCRFWYDNNNKLRLHDFSRKIHYDYIDIVQKLHYLNYHDALRRIAYDFNIDRSKSVKPLITTKKIRKTKTEIKVQVRNWEKRDFEYWNKYKIDQFHNTEKFLTYFKIFPCNKIWINGIKYNVKNQLCYAYYLGTDINNIDNIKIYFPLREKDKFMQNDPSVLQGFYQLPKVGKNLIITKSLKDVVCLRLFNIYAVAPSSETVLLTKEQFTDLYNRFDNILSLMDSDKTGKHAAWQLRKQYEIQPLFFEKDYEKDFSDNLEVIDIIEMHDIIEYTKQLII